MILELILVQGQDAIERILRLLLTLRELVHEPEHEKRPGKYVGGFRGLMGMRHPF